ncbi:DNA translocase FtsK [Puteibacter caeruleilacunae]|nr:DNA translocase FtsK [Puteibacter caeruleilacunae]
MAQKKKSRKAKKRFNLNIHLSKEQIRTAIGIIFVAFGIYLLVAFVSFLLSGGADQSLLNDTNNLLSNSGVKASNEGGKGGVWIADWLINDGFGLAAFIIVYLIGATGLKIIGVNVPFYRRSLFISLFALVWLSLFFGFFFVDSYSDSFLYLGGLYGYFISNWMVSIAGTAGTFLVLLASLLVFVIVSFESSLPFMKRVLAKRDKNVEDVVDDEIEDEIDPNIPEEYLEPQDDTISKVVDENDTVEAVFSPDDNDIEEPVNTGEIDLTEETPIETSLETQIENTKVEVSEGPELTVEEKTEEQVPAVKFEDLEDYDPTLDLSRYKFPSVELMDEHGSNSADVSNDELISNKNRIVETLRNYKIEIVKIKATIGPTVTLYEIVPAPGVRIAKIKNLEDDIALSLSALGIRIIAPIPGKGTIGIEVPNRKPEVVSMKSVIASKKFQESTAELPIAMGKTISNETYVVDLAKMPHVLVAGATGQGKSVGLNAIIASLLYKKHPSQLKFVFIDPKKVELSLYSSIENHFLAKMPDEEEPIITDIHRVKATLNSVNIEMDTRYDLLKKAHARNIKEYNKKFITRKLNPEKGHRYLPYIVVVIDEFADLIMTAGKDIETPIARIAQLARAVGIHMIIATQRPSTNIITGVIKANFPARIAFKVASMIDSRTILDTPGANQLIGKGDMLISNGGLLTRVQCAFVDTPEVERICDCISEQKGYPSAFLLPEFVEEGAGDVGEADLKNTDELFEDAARLVVMNQSGSTSLIQRKFSIGYNRAGRIMDQLEAASIVGPSEGSKARQVMVHDEYALEQLLETL